MRDLRRRAHAGWCEQEATEGTETDSILCFLSFLLWNWQSESYCADDANYPHAFLSVSIRVIRGLILCAVARPAVTADPERVGRRFLRLDEHVAEKGRCTEPPFALGTGALEIWVFQKSGPGGR